MHSENLISLLHVSRFKDSRHCNSPNRSQTATKSPLRFSPFPFWPDWNLFSPRCRAVAAGRISDFGFRISGSSVLRPLSLLTFGGATLLLCGELHAADLVHAKDGSGVYGYKDTPNAGVWTQS
jgi:hypothetical protein